jgi:glycosyltransferase involved in cell wall biosynthesis
MTLLIFLYSQCILFFRILIYLKKDDRVYINSLLPFGAALAARIRRKQVIYHFHEVSIKPMLLKKFLISIAGFTASKGIFVSQDLAKRTGFKKPCSIVYNSLPASFIEKAEQNFQQHQHQPFHVLMICSLKKYKGVDEFLECARRLKSYDFTLVVNATQQAIDAYFNGVALPPNITIFPAQKDVHAFYRKADLVMNLSRPDGWIETFGMTILEAMYYRRPVIVPPVGGITELVEHEAEGFRVDSRRMDELCLRIEMLAENRSMYSAFSKNAFLKTAQFGPAQFRHGILDNFQKMDSPIKAKEPVFNPHFPFI